MRSSFEFGRPGEIAGPAPYRLLVAGTFRGDAPPPAGDTRLVPRRVDTDGFDELLTGLLGTLTLHPGDRAESVAFRPASIKSFRPEFLATQIVGGEAVLVARDHLSQLRGRRLTRTAAREKLSVLKLPRDLSAALDAIFDGGAFAGGAAPPAAAEPAAPRPSAPAPPPPSPETGGSSLDNLFALVDEDETASKTRSGSTDSGEPAVDPAIAALSSLIGALAGSGVAGSADDAQVGTLALKAVDAWLGARINEILADPRFRARESAWRGLRFLLQRGPYREGILVDLVDVRPGTADLAPLLDQLATMAATEETGHSPYNLVLWLDEWPLDAAGIVALKEVAPRAAALQLPVVASAGLHSLADLADELAADWHDLGRRSEAGWLALAVNPFLLRGRYAPELEPVKTFDFTEGDEAFEMPDGPWGSPALLVGAATAQAFIRDGWPTRIEGADGGTIEALPVRPVEHGGRTVQLSGQVPLPDQVVGLLGRSGFIACVPPLDRDEMVLFRAPSLKSTPATVDGNVEAAVRLEASLPFRLAVNRLTDILSRALRRLPPSASPEEVVAGVDRVLSEQGSGRQSGSDARVALQSGRGGASEIVVRWRPGPPILPAAALIELTLPYPHA